MAPVVRVFSPSNFLKSLGQLRPVTGAIVVLAVALPWYILVSMRTDGLWLKQFLGTENLQRFVKPSFGHSGPVWYYIPAVLIGFFPWSVFLGPAAIDSVRRIRERHPWRDSHILLACWFGASFIFWSICSTKLPHYLLPVYPALALLTGCFLETWLTQPVRVGPGWIKNAWITTILVGVGIMVAVPFVARIYVPGEELIGLVGMILVIGGYFCLISAKQHQRERAVIIFTCTSVLFLTAIFGFAALRVDQHQNAKRLFAEIRRDSSEPAFVCAYRFFRQSLVYYAGHPVPYCITPEQLQQFLEHKSRAYIITLDEYKAEIDRQHPGQFRVLARSSAFWPQTIWSCSPEPTKTPKPPPLRRHPFRLLPTSNELGIDSPFEIVLFPRSGVGTHSLDMACRNRYYNFHCLVPPIPDPLIPMPEETLRQQLYDSFKNRALIYYYIFDELRTSLAPSARRNSFPGDLSSRRRKGPRKIRSLRTAGFARLAAGLFERPCR